MIFFKDIQFGQASAELESSYYPDLLINGFLDPWDIIDQAQNSPKFLFLGYKGSGKSAIGEHLRLKSDSIPSFFVNRTFLRDFPYGNFSKIVTGDAEPESRFPSAWSWILLLYILDSFSKDAGSISNQDPSFVQSIQRLKNVGILPTDDIKQTVIASSKPKFKAKLPQIFEVDFDPNIRKISDIQFLHIIQQIKNLTLSFKTSNKHLLIIDGLDDILLQKEIQYQSLAALILEASRLNMDFGKYSVPAKIIVLCRTELYEKLPGPNKNKIRQDLSIELDWYHNPSKPTSSKLVYLANKRAQLSDINIKDIFIQLLPRELNGEPLLTFLLHHTRHTPRDFIQLLKYIQKCSSRKKVEIRNIIAGIGQYSSKYFLPEIKDELVGYINRSDAEEILNGIAAMKKRRFSTNDLAKNIYGNFDLAGKPIIPMLETLFNCSAIGNIKKMNNKNYFSFKYRNRHATFVPTEEIFLHRGLWRGMNII